MTDYFDNYKRRMSIIGESFSDRMDNDAKKVYETYMKDKGSSTAVINLNEYQVSMIHDKENESVEQYVVLADLDAPFETGTVFEIDCQFYIIIYEEETRHHQYFKGYARKCTHEINIKTEFGTYSYQAYVQGTSEPNMKETTKGSMIIQDDQASGKIILQKDENFAYISAAKTRFFVGDDVYKVTGKNSLMNMGYLDIEKDIINTFKDNKVLYIANYYDEEEMENNYYISATLISGVVLEKDSVYDINNVLDIQVKDDKGNFISEPYTMDAIATEINITGVNITPLIFGNIKIYLTLDNDKNSRTEVILNVMKENTTSYITTGEEELVWSEESTYSITKLLAEVEIPSTWAFTLDEGESLVTLITVDDNSCTLTAAEGKVGTVVLLGTNGAEEVRIKIIVKAWW